MCCLAMAMGDLAIQQNELAASDPPVMGRLVRYVRTVRYAGREEVAVGRSWLSWQGRFGQPVSRSRR